MPPQQDLVAVGHELFDATRRALIDATLPTILLNPVDQFAHETTAPLTKAKQGGAPGGAHRKSLGFDIDTPENVFRRNAHNGIFRKSRFGLMCGADAQSTEFGDTA